MIENSVSCTSSSDAAGAAGDVVVGSEDARHGWTSRLHSRNMRQYKSLQQGQLYCCTCLLEHWQVLAMLLMWDVGMRTLLQDGIARLLSGMLLELAPEVSEQYTDHNGQLGPGS